MKNFKKLICFFLVFVMTVLQLSINTFAFSTVAEELNEVNGIPSFSDDFNSYDADITNKGNSVELGGGWSSKAAGEGTMGQNNELDFGFNGSALYISTATKTHEKNINDMMGYEAGVVRDISSEIGENQVISFTATKTHASDAWGLKFLKHNDGNDYYAIISGGLYMKSYVGGFLAFGLYRFNDGVPTALCEITKDNASQIGAGGLSNITIGYNNGTISWNVVHGSTNYKGSVVDTSPFSLDGKDLSVELFTTGSDSPQRHVLFDDFKVIKNVPYLTSSEPDKTLYVDIYGNASVSDEVVDFYNEYPIRKIISSQSANNSFDLYLSNDKENWSVVSDLKFDSNGVWENNLVNSAFRYAALSIVIPTDIKILSDAQADKVYTSLLGKQLDLYAKFGDVVDNAQIDWELSQDSATIENGVIIPARRGSLIASASYGDDVLEVNIDIQGELDVAIRNNTVDTYITNNKPVVDEINRGINLDDNEVIEAVLRNTGEYKISDIVDIESSKITSLEEITPYINRIKTYGEFDFADVDDVYKFFDTFEKEYYVGLACNVADTISLEDIFNQRNDYLGLSLENQFYLKYKEDVLALLTDKDFVNLNDLQKKFESAYILEALDNALSVEMVETIVSNSQTEIGYDEEKFKDNKGIDMYGAVLENKDKITTIELFKDFINKYEKPEEEEEDDDDEPVRRPSSGGGGGGFRVDTSIVEKINTETIPEKIETPVTNKTVFVDVTENHWAYNSILNLYNKNIISGNPDGSFAPEKTVTRAEFVKMLLAALQIKSAEDNQNIEFLDVKESDWYYTYFVTACNKGIIAGDGNGTMRPNDKISREEMAVIIYRALNFGETKTDVNLTFGDKDVVSSWALEAVEYLTAENILKGNNENEFNPQRNATRAESATVIERIMK